MSDEFTFEDLKNIIIDKKQPVATDELLLLIAEYFGDEEIEKVISEHVDELYSLFDRCSAIEARLINAKLLCESAATEIEALRTLRVEVKEDSEDGEETNS